MAKDAPAVGDNANDKVEPKPVDAVLSREGNAEVVPPGQDRATIKPISPEELKARLGERAAERGKEVTLRVDEAIKAIREGKLDPNTRYEIKVDSSAKSKGGRNEAAELFAAMKERSGSMLFDKGYHEAPFYKQSGAGIISTSESKIALAKELTLQIGDKSVTLPPGQINADKSTVGSVFPNGTVIDQPSGQIRSVDPNAKGVMVGEHFIPNGTVIPKEFISTQDGHTGQSFKPGDLLKARQTTDAQGRPILDSHPIDEKTFAKKWDKVSENVYGTKKSPTEHIKLPPNVTVKSITEYSDGKAVQLDPGTYFRADGYSVTPKDLLETWNGYAGDEKAYEHIKAAYSEQGKSDSPHAKMMDENRVAFKAEHAEKNVESKAVTLGVDEAIKAIKEGKLDPNSRYEIKVDSSAKSKGGRNEAAELFAAMKERSGSMLFDKGYHEAPFYKQSGAGIISTSESKIALAKELTLQIGDKSVTLPPGKINADKSTVGSVFPNGTVIDQPSGQIRSVDPNAKGVMVGEHFIPNGTVIPKEFISTQDGHTGQSFKPGDLLKARQTTDAQGRPILDSHPIDEKTFAKKWDKVSENVYGTKKSPTEHIKLPPNVTVKSITEYSDGKAVQLDPGTYFRADGYSVTPKDLLETWNGYAGDEKAYEHIKAAYADQGKSDSPHAKMMNENRLAFQQSQDAARLLKVLEQKGLAKNVGALTDRQFIGSTKAQRDALKENAFISGKLVPLEQVREWAQKGSIPESVIRSMEFDAARGAIGVDVPTATAVIEALESKIPGIKDEAAKRLAASVIEQTRIMQVEAAAERKNEVSRDMKASGASLVALAAIAAGILAYTHPEETEALVKATKSRLKELGLN